MNTYDLLELPEWRFTGEDVTNPFPKWSGTKAPPAIGARITLKRGWGEGTVLSYYVEYGYLGIFVELDTPPAWWVAQSKGRTRCHFFGNDLVTS